MHRPKCPATGKYFQAMLVDDGTLDTVYKCTQCNERLRYVEGDELDFSTNQERIRYFRKQFMQDHEND